MCIRDRLLPVHLCHLAKKIITTKLTFEDCNISLTAMRGTTPSLLFCLQMAPLLPVQLCHLAEKIIWTCRATTHMCRGKKQTCFLATRYAKNRTRPAEFAVLSIDGATVAYAVMPSSGENNND